MKQIIFACPNIPILQNRVYDGQEAARGAPSGDLEIWFDNDFGWNNKFDPSLMKYDDQYNNTVPSSKFNSYYDYLADYLVDRYDTKLGPIIDIGCGKGTFLKRMADRYEIMGLGIDPSYVGPAEIGNLRFIAEEFHQRHVDFKPSLLLCRHTLEHIPNPESFLAFILESFPKNSKIPIFCEVPDLYWIIKQKSWWDFCYEHVNYFTQNSFRRCLENAGCFDVMMTPEFGDQYLWGEGVIGSSNAPIETNVSESLIIDRMNSQITEMLKKIQRFSHNRKLVIWGMATKGVMYALHALRHGIPISYGVDINTEKQGKFAPVSGLPIYAPEDLPKDQSYAVLCMNPNYIGEIREDLERLNLDFVLLEPTGNKV